MEADGDSGACTDRGGRPDGDGELTDLVNMTSVLRLGKVQLKEGAFVVSLRPFSQPKSSITSRNVSRLYCLRKLELNDIL